ncbi:MAG: hypothetical protein NXY57DRAFT_962667 [Lentinula lateritia]|uniref:uncharacterized protein n=1 Tax=Lentinula edodes TaxID=5353 RepID=UPI001E8DC5F3|nr:uncharacterized protein C8R40DRAFT_1171912 [Lentinula edodes]KAH7873983.1 hypothetical protein C8R40DRAFT_1171912 [Lentinula edodes]KAJ3930466.1 MAG: hypothetical protein NXY57DRAFT_962667 [Lentinula lateritia]
MASTIVLPRQIPLWLCPELLGEYLSYIRGVDLDSCSQVCHYWSEPAKMARFRVIDVDDSYLLTLLESNPRHSLYVRCVIGGAQSMFAHTMTPYPIRLRSLEIRGYDVVSTGDRINQAIVAFSPTITSFTIHSCLRMSYSAFYGLLQSLTHCKLLEKLTLPSPARILDENLTPEQRAEEANAAFQTLPHGTEDKVKLSFMQLIPTSYRHDPQYTHNPAMKTPHTWMYGWLDPEICPFDLHELATLVIGSARAAEVLLPRISEHLTRLQFCLPFDNRSSWKHYEYLRRSPIILSSLKHLSMTFHIRPSKYILDIIRAPAIKTIHIEWNTSISYSTYEAQFQRIDRQISRLDDSHVFPCHLSNIRLVTIFCPDAHWCTQAFPVCTLFGVNVSSYVSTQTL